MKDKSKLTAIILVFVTIIVVVLSFFLNKETEKDESKIKIATNYSDFYTVNSCLYRTITYISSGDKKSLLLLLSDKYKKEKNIDDENVINLFESIENDSVFVSKKMYYQSLNNNVTKYYVYGHVEKNEIFDDEIITQTERKDMYFIVYLDRNNKIFSIEPYSGDIFIGGGNNE